MPGWRRLPAALLAAIAVSACAGNPTGPTSPTPQSRGSTARAGADEGMKPYSTVITSDMATDDGLFDVHQKDGKVFYEIPNDVLGSELLLVTSIARTASDIGYGGQRANTQVVRWVREGDRVLLHITNVEETPEELLQLVMNSPYTRLPLWRDTPENIVGVLHVKALFRAVQAAEGDLGTLDFMSIASKPWFIPDSTDLLLQLQAFRARKEHIAIVVDEYGEMLGIVTLEDILEEIVGDISDETDIGVEGVDLLQDGTAIVAGTVTIRDLNRRCDWRLPDEEASTVAGLVLHEARLIPDVGRTFSFYGFRFEILGRQRNQITLLKITPLSDEEKEAESATS